MLDFCFYYFFFNCFGVWEGFPYFNLFSLCKMFSLISFTIYFCNLSGGKFLDMQLLQHKSNAASQPH